MIDMKSATIIFFLKTFVFGSEDVLLFVF